MDRSYYQQLEEIRTAEVRAANFRKIVCEVVIVGMWIMVAMFAFTRGGEFAAKRCLEDVAACHAIAGVKP